MPYILMDLICPFESAGSNLYHMHVALLGHPSFPGLPPTRVLQQLAKYAAVLYAIKYAHKDDWADFLLTDSAHC